MIRRVLLQRPILTSVVLLGVGAGFGGTYFLAKSADSDTSIKKNTTEPSQEGVSVTTITSKPGTISRKCIQPGTVHAFFETKVQARVSGYLKTLNVDIGDPVEPNQALAELAVPELNRKKERLEAELRRAGTEQSRARAEAEVAVALAASRRALVEQARANVQKAEAHVALCNAELERVAGLVKQNVLSGQNQDEYRNHCQAAEAGHREAKAALVAAEAELRVAEAKVKAANAEVEVAAARAQSVEKEGEELKAWRDYATLRSPFRGVVTARNVDLGDLVKASEGQSGGKELFRIAQLDKVRVRMSVPERDVPLAKPGKKAYFQTTAIPGKVFEGKVRRIASSLDPTTRTMLVEIEFENPDHALLPGMFGQATLFLEEREDRLVLPIRAVHHDNAGKCYVLFADADGKVARAEVITGQDDGKSIEVLQGLAKDAQIITSDPNRIAPGQRVQCVKEK